MARIDEYLKKIAGEQVTPPAPVSSLARELSDIPEITGGGIPDITESDVGKVLTAAEDGAGGYAPAWDTVEGGGIPEITESDVGKVLTAAEDGAGGYVPTWATGGGGSAPLFVLIAEDEYSSPSVVGWTTQNYATKAGEVAAAILAGTPVYIKAGAYDGTAGDIPDEAITLLAPVVAAVPDGDTVFSIRSALHAYQDASVIGIMGYTITLGGLGIDVEKINHEIELATPGD